MSDDLQEEIEQMREKNQRLREMSKFRGVSSGRGEESIDRSTDADFLLLYGKLPVLVLCHDSQGWRMFYTKEFKAQKKVKPLVPFPEVDKEYRSSELWPFFAVRIPSISRPEVLRTVQAERLDYNDVAAMLNRFGRKSIASPFELKEVSDDAPVPDWFTDQVLGGDPWPDAEWD